MEIPLDLARTLDAVVTAGSLDAAAAALSITPSAVSQRLKSLETRVGRVLLVRSKPVQPTAAGLALVRLSRQLSALEQDTPVSYTHLDVYKRQGNGPRPAPTARTTRPVPPGRTAGRRRPRRPTIRCR